MEKGLFSVEWLAQSSRRTPDNTSVCTFPWEQENSGCGWERDFKGPLSPRANDQTKNNRSGQQENQVHTILAATCKDRSKQPAHRILSAINSGGSEQQHTSQERTPGCGWRRSSEVPRAEEPLGCQASSSTCPGPVQEEDPEGARPRTKFTTEQLQELERSFQEQRYIGVKEKRRLARVLKLSELRIKTWFQNRRMKFKRQSQDARVEAFFSGLLLPYSGYQEARTPDCLPRTDFMMSPSSASALATGLSAVSLQPALGHPGLQPVPFQGRGPCTYPNIMPPLPFSGEHESLMFLPYFSS